MFVTEKEPLAWFEGRRVTVMGLGLFGGGRGAARFLAEHGAHVTVTDRRPASILEPEIAELRDLPIRWVLEEHREEDFLGADLVVPSPAVPRTAPLLEACRRSGVPLDTEMNLFFKHCSGAICAVTGSNGKTTTTSLLGAMAARRWPGTRVGGNLGKSLLPEVESILPGEWVILELSSFQLEDLASIERRPEISVVTNLSPNHLDRHGTYEAYLDAKRQILLPARGVNAAVLNAEDPLLVSWRSPRRETFFFGARKGAMGPPPGPGAWLDEDPGEVRWFHAGEDEGQLLFQRKDLSLPGRFNVLNAAGAAAAGRVMGLEPVEITEAVRAFQAVEHRLEPVVEHEGIEYLNDSIATTPESTIAALEALGPNVVLICGGSSKGSSFESLGRTLARRARGVVLLGETAESIRRSIPDVGGGPEVLTAVSLEDAVEKARSLARPGDRVILSPACASFDMFVNFVERGRRFKEIARRLAASARPEPGRSLPRRG
ncbi:MAG TPA: UDP-N-acetylmuramoyl-L-alanine--D-glutamate ligase [Planctomycetota bacterium]|nr:UDP-N-acetylmuramoyl-L-alanine--D-glutamate ligase [Planctomycetota bacterium]